MTDFETTAELSLVVPDSELRSARSEIESIGSVPVSVEGGRATTGSSAMTDGGIGAVESQLDEANDYLEEIADGLGGSGAFGGGGGGGGPTIIPAGGRGLVKGAGKLGLLGLLASAPTAAGEFGGDAAQLLADDQTANILDDIESLFKAGSGAQGPAINAGTQLGFVAGQKISEFLSGFGSGGGGTDTVTSGSEAGGTDVGNDSGSDIVTGDVDGTDQDVDDSTFNPDAGAGSGRQQLIPGVNLGGGGSQTTLSAVSGFVPPALEAAVAGAGAGDGRVARAAGDVVNDVFGGGQQGPNQVKVDVAVENQQNQQQLVRDVAKEVERNLGRELGDSVSGFL